MAQVFCIDDYLEPSEVFHFARKALPTDAATPLHSHDYYELMLVESGATTHMINDSQAPLREGDVVFVRPSDTHGFRTDDACRIINIMFRAETADVLLERYREDLYERFFWSSGRLPTCIHLVGAQHERAINTSRTLQTTLQTQLRLEHFLLTMMTFVLDDVARIHPSAPGWLVDACYAAQSPEVFRKGSAGFVAAAKRGPEHVSRQTRKYLGMSPTGYVNRLRIQHAAMLLRQGKLPLPEIAEDCGIENLSYFHRLFREQYGCTPDTYRKRHHQSPLKNG
ncbi:helix-turn-helix transcriptional regulator [Mameliella sediminis]|uniref:helix-turn-helix transcriptional regulator n=1 Tax=Mameliella sediminis TaxID=2836866 RepID=UPI001C48F55A|nr:AraC family transcriptional regulator [Mameliella sediminis]MBV7397144.1 AraC family transcriptional regulator [Mameliella sediminis]MBY6116979.1 AraC family transcriptional regulator [Antarctobacter heliothermus]MBY6146732.1 AraC family transcriptional regulator [Mameliella alba]MCA0957004.1 AraC family transcriptional regulator [Mameliella alba]